MSDEVSDAAIPTEPGERMALEATSGDTLHYSAQFQGSNIDYYFNLEKKVFLCETIIKQQTAKMTGIIKEKTEKGTYLCTPAWGIKSFYNEKEKWEDISSDEVKELAIGEEEIDFKPIKLKKV
mmetsp:Transcript_25143/g.26217  ORF Transcript_25143/g.26217 Transcript_25143/m.26217 type:complete len:123 (-) Transcript_25143:39-407(-)